LNEAQKWRPGPAGPPKKKKYRGVETSAIESATGRSTLRMVSEEEEQEGEEIEMMEMCRAGSGMAGRSDPTRGKVRSSKRVSFVVGTKL
jgi:hypothetical protein